MNMILFDDPVLRDNLLPFTYTRPVADIRIGILTVREKWEKVLALSSSTWTEAYLSEKFPCKSTDDNLLINGGLLPTAELISLIKSLPMGKALKQGKHIIAARLKAAELKKYSSTAELKHLESEESTAPVFMIKQVWDIFSRNGEALKADFALLTNGRESQPLSASNQYIGNAEAIFLEEGAKVECAILNATSGPIYIGKDAEVMEGSIIRGPFALCDHSTIKMGAKIYGPTTIGPHSKVGGEINNSVVFGFSNKAHDGFLGNSVIGEWCNLGADTNNSNLKNNYSSVKIYSMAKAEFIDTGLQFCGLMMGDHSKCAINTMFNTGTVVGVNANIFGSGFPAKFIPSFSWDGADEQATFTLAQACSVAAKVVERRNLVFTETDRKILESVFNITASSRYWEKR